MTNNEVVLALKKINFFSELDKKNFESICSDFRLVNIPKDKLLFGQEDIARNFYIVHEGSFLIYYLNHEGEELITEITQEHDYLHDIFYEKFIVSAKAIKNSSILSINRLTLIEFIKKNSDFAYSFFIKNSQQSNKTFLHLIELKSNNGKFKVANFLIGLLFDQGLQNKQVILKYSKSLIASYLGIKSETLSRILQKMKKEGEISIKKNIITFHKIDSICNYCNQRINEKCQEKKCI